VTVQELTVGESARVAAFGLDRPVGADDGVRYAHGDPDPTPQPGFGGLYCAAESPEDLVFCTWPRGHGHPQHVAAGTAGIVVVAWPAASVLQEPTSDASWRERSVALLRLQEQASRDEARRIRAHYDEGGAMAPSVSEVIRQEARAGAFASAVEIVEGTAI